MGVVKLVPAAPRPSRTQGVPPRSTGFLTLKSRDAERALEGERLKTQGWLPGPSMPYLE